MKLIAGLSLLLIIPIIGLYSVVAIPTISYKQGVRVGAKEGKASANFTAVGELVGAFLGIWILVVVLLAFLPDGESDGGGGRSDRFPPAENRPVLTGSEAAGKAEGYWRAELARRDGGGLISPSCEPEEFNNADILSYWIVRCSLQGLYGDVPPLHYRMKVVDGTGSVSVIR